MLSIRFKRGTAAANDALTENAGVLTVDTDVFGLRIHDGSTPGGHALVVGSSITSLQSQIDTLGIEGVDGLDAALAAKVGIDLLGVDGGVTKLNPEGVIPTEQLPSFVEDVIQVSSEASLPATGEIGKLYVTEDTNELFRWSGGQAQYYQISATIDSTDNVSEGQVNLYYTDSRSRDSFSATGDVTYDPVTGVFTLNQSIDSVAGRTGAVVVDKDDVGLGSVLNYPVASIQESIEATISDKYVVPSSIKALAESMGFVEENGSWSFQGKTLPKEVLDGIFTSLTTLSNAQGNFTGRGSSGVYNGKLYIQGGVYGSAQGTAELREFDPSTNTWSLVDNQGPVKHQNTGTVYNGSFYSIGGYGVESSTDMTLWRYDFSTGQWSQLAAAPVHTNHGALIEYQGNFYLLGATSYGGNVQKYDIDTDTWSLLTAAPTSISYWKADIVDGVIYAVGGSVSGGSNYSDNFMSYDIASDSWTQLPALPFSGHSFSVSSYNGRLYSYGGFAGGGSAGYLKDLWTYNPQNGQWTNLGQFSSAGSIYGEAQFIGDELILVSGLGAEGLTLKVE